MTKKRKPINPLGCVCEDCKSGLNFSLVHDSEKSWADANSRFHRENSTKEKLKAINEHMDRYVHLGYSMLFGDIARILLKNDAKVIFKNKKNQKFYNDIVEIIKKYSPKKHDK